MFTVGRMQESRRIFRDTLLTLVAMVIFGSTNFVFNVAIGRFYGSEILGEISASLSTSLLLSYFVATGFPRASSKYISEYIGKNKENEANYIFKLALKYGVLISIAITGIAIIFLENIASIFDVSEHFFLLSLPLIPLYGIYMILKMTYYGYRRVKKYFKNEIISDTVFFASLGIIIFFENIYLVYTPYILLYLIFIILSITFFRNKFKIDKNFNRKKLQKKFFIYAGIAFVGTFSSMAMRNLSIMISSMYLPKSDVGFLSAALSVSTIFFLFPNALNRILLPEFSYTFGKGDKEKLTKLLNKSTEYVSFFVTLVNSLGIIFAPIIIDFFYSSEFADSVILLQILLFSYWFTMVARPAVASLSGTKYVHISNSGGVLGLFTAICGWIFLIPTYGIIGTAIGYLLGIVVNTLVIVIFAHKYYRFEIWILCKHFILISFILLIILLHLTVIFALCLICIYIIAGRKVVISFLKYFKHTDN